MQSIPKKKKQSWSSAPWNWFRQSESSHRLAGMPTQRLQPANSSRWPRLIPDPSPNLCSPPQTSKRKPKSRPTPTRQREAQPGQTPTAASVLRPRPLPTSDHIIWDEAGLSPPSSVRVRPQTPTMRGGGANYPSKRRGTIEMCASKKWKMIGKQKGHLHLQSMAENYNG